MQKIYFDHNSTTLLNNSAIKAIKLELENITPLNASSQHSYGRQANKKLNNARKQIANLLNVNINTHDIIFTSSGTNSNHIIINHCLNNEIEIFCSEIEHISIYGNVQNKIPINQDGIVCLKALQTILYKYRLHNPNKKMLVSIMMANNEIGTINNLVEISKICKKYNAFLHSDCSQSIGKIPFNFNELGIDFATISSHKIGGPHGISVLIAIKKTIISSLKGGGQEFSVNHGSENIIGAIAFAAALTEAINNLNNYQNHTLKLRNYLEDKLQDNTMIICQNTNRLPNTVMLVPYVESPLIFQKLDLAGICISSGSACSSGDIKISYVLHNLFEKIKNNCHQKNNLDLQNKDINENNIANIIANEYNFDLIKNIINNQNTKGIRISFGINNTIEEVELFVNIWKKALI